VIADNGSGFDPSRPSTGFGLSGMRDRLALVGGTLDISSSTKGTLVTVTVPADPLVTFATSVPA
jgi:signal transduction histidine kinase